MQILESIKILPKKKETKPKFQVLVLRNTPAKNSYHGEILGRSLADWVAFACNGKNVKIIDFDGNEKIVAFAKNYINIDFDYTIILLSSTPLITQATIDNIIEYSTYKQINLCKLPVGYVVNNKYLQKESIPVVDSLYSQNLEDFFLVENKKQYTQAEEILQERINTFHINNDVEIKKPKSVYIEPEVDIASGVVIFAGNTLKGQSVISKDVILKENNVIDHSKVGKNSCISGSVIDKSIISSNVYISSFCEIYNSLIGDNTTIESGCKIYNYNVKSGSKIKANSVLGESDDSNSGTRKSGQKL